MKNHFICQDISLASYLKSQGIVIIDLEKELNHFLFIFENKSKCDELSKGYWNEKAIGNIKKYEEAKQTLISMIKNKR